MVGYKWKIGVRPCPVISGSGLGSGLISGLTHCLITFRKLYLSLLYSYCTLTHLASHTLITHSSHIPHTSLTHPSRTPHTPLIHIVLIECNMRGECKSHPIQHPWCDTAHRRHPPWGRTNHPDYTTLPLCLHPHRWATPHGTCLPCGDTGGWV